MATSQKIEENIIADIKALLDAASISNVISEYAEKPETATLVRIAVFNMRDELDAGTVPSGMRRATINLEAQSYEADDVDGADLNALVSSIRTVIYDNAILTSLNTASTYNTYYGLLAGDDIPDTENKYRIKALQFDLILKPEK